MRHSRWCFFRVLATSLLLVLMVTGCDLSGGSSEEEGGGVLQPAANEPSVLPSTTVAIEGIADDGQDASPIANAICEFVDRDGAQLDQTIANADGEFRLDVPPEQQGFVQCSPRLFPKLRLSTFVSTVGKSAGERIPEQGLEEVSPQTTVVTELMAIEAPADLQTRKEEIMADIAAQDPTLMALANAATAMYKPLLVGEINVSFGEEVARAPGNTESAEGDGGSDGGGPGGDDGGVEGDADDGGEFSSIANAICDFALTLDGEVFISTVLADLFDNGTLDRPDLQDIAALVNQELTGREAEIANAFAARFPLGIGRPLQVSANSQGRYFLPTPPNTPGFVRCRPPNQENLVLATFVRARQADETLTGQDVTPQTTVFSTNVASKLEENVADTKQNYLNDIAGLEVKFLGEGGNPTGFEVANPENVNDHDVGIVAFSSAALFNTLFKKGINVSFLQALDELVTTTSVTPAFLASLGVPASQAGSVADIVNASNTTAEAQLETELGAAFSTARLIVQVREAPSDAPIQGASVDVSAAAGNAQCQNCPASTDANGIVILTFTGVPLESPAPITVAAALAGFEDNTATANVVAFATVKADIALTAVSGNQPPVANADAYSVLESTTLVVDTATGVLANDSDLNDDPPDILTATLVTEPVHGSVNLLADGAFTYTPTANFSGTDTFTYQVSDDGGTANDDDDTGNIATATIVVTAVNDAPSFTPGPNQSVPENIGPQVVTGWASAISPGPPDEAAQTVTFLVSNDNNGLFAAQPAITATGTLTYTPATDITGQATVTVHLQDDGGTADGGQDTSPEVTFTITVVEVNNAPSFTPGPDQTVLEDAGPQSIANWATNISPGPPDEAAQTVTFLASNDNNGLFAVQPAIAPNGTLTYTPTPHANGQATVTVQLQDNGGTAFDGQDTSPAVTFTITVSAVNDAPSFTRGPHQVVLEDSGLQTESDWATNLSPGPPDESSQTMTFVVSNDNNALFAPDGQPAISPDGTLTYTPASNATGQATVTVQLQDDGGTANGGQDTSPAQMFTIDVVTINEPPSFTPGPNQVVFEDDGLQTVSGWATNISPGPPDEASQTVTFLVTNDNNALFAVQPAIDASGALTYTLAPNANGQTTVTVKLQDDGGLAFGGQDTSPAVTFTITVTAVNDAPSFTPGPDQTAPVNSGLRTVQSWAVISLGPADEASQTVTLDVSNDNNALFAVQPAIAATGTLTYTPAADTTGQATVTVQPQDNGGTANGGQDTGPAQTFTITVVEINDPPSFTLGPSQVVSEDAGAQTVPGWATSISPGPPDEASQTVTFVVTNDNNALFAPSEQPAISPDGTLTYTPAVNTTGQATVTVQLQDDGGTDNGGQNTSLPGTFTITVATINDAPSFTPGPNQGVAENAGPQTVPDWATDIKAGPPDEASQTVMFIVTNDNPALFAVQPAISPDGTLTYTPAANTTGQATVTVQLQDNGGTANGGQDTSSPPQTFTITVQSGQALVALDRDRNAVVRIDLASGTCTTISDASTGSGPAFASPADLAIEATSTPVVVEDGFGLAALLRVVPATGDRTIVSDATTGTGALLVHPLSVAVESASGDLMVTDDGFGVFAVLRVDPTTGDRTVISNASTGIGPDLIFPKAIIETNGQLFVVDASLRAVVQVDPVTGNRTIVSNDTTGTGDPFVLPMDIAVEATGQLVVTDTSLRAVLRVDPTTGNRTVVSDDTIGSGDPFVAPMDIVIEADGNLLVVDNFLARVVRVDSVTGDRTTVTSPDCE